MNTQLYLHQLAAWPKQGKHILARFDAESIYVYQAYRPSIAQFAVTKQRFGGEFSYTRMSWIKPNFLWMMHRAGWAKKDGQERILSVRLSRLFFDEILRLAVPSTFEPTKYSTQVEWQRAVAASDVRLQWDPDHDALGRTVERRAVQLGLRGSVLRRYGEREILSIEDITPFVVEQSTTLDGNLEALRTPEEHVYVPNPVAAEAASLDVP